MNGFTDMNTKKYEANRYINIIRKLKEEAMLHKKENKTLQREN